MRITLRKLLLIPIFLSCSPAVSSGQIKLKLSAESGAFFSSEIEGEKKWQNRFNLKAAYKKRDAESTLEAEIGFRPELIGVDNQLRILTGEIRSRYSRIAKLFNWRFLLSGMGQSFTASLYDYQNEILNISFQIDNARFLPKKLFIQTGYSFRNSKFEYYREMDLLYLKTGLNFPLKKFSSITVMAHIDRFIVQEDKRLRYFVDKIKNRGFRIGPELNINYIRNVILKGDYKFFYHHSEITKDFSFEQFFQIAAGFRIFPNFMLFLMINYYNSHFNKIESNDLYFPPKYENSVSFKLSYKLESKLKLYLRSAYSSYNFSDGSNALDGFSILLGLEKRASLL